MLLQKLKIFFSVIFMLFITTSCVSNLDIQTLNKKANDLMAAGDVDGAIARLESINDLNPNFPQTNYNLGIAYYKKGDKEKALNALNKAVELNRNFADDYYSIAVIYEDEVTAATSIQDGETNVNLNKEKENKILEYLYRARDNYSHYISLAKDQPDIENVKNKISYLNDEIVKYESQKLPQTSSENNY